MTDLALVREQYREGKNALFASLANSRCIYARYSQACCKALSQTH